MVPKPYEYSKRQATGFFLLPAFCFYPLTLFSFMSISPLFFYGICLNHKAHTAHLKGATVKLTDPFIKLANTIWLCALSKASTPL